MSGPPDSPAPGKVTLMLRAVQGGDTSAAEQLLPLVYDELRRLAQSMMAHERPGHTLQATALVHDAYLRLAGTGSTWQDRRHFFNAAALAMRRILIERARSRGSKKRGSSDQQRIGLEMIEIPVTREFRLDQIEELSRVLDALALHNGRWAEIVQLRFFLGLTIEQAAEMLGLGPATVKSDWSFARAWLHWKLKEGVESDRLR